MVVVTDPKGMFLDLQREDKGFITKAEGGRELHVDAKYARWYADKDKVETSTAEDLGDDNIIDEDEIMVDDDDLDGI
jgi:RPA family protein